jgi:reverse gyrase
MANCINCAGPIASPEGERILHFCPTCYEAEKNNYPVADIVRLLGKDGDRLVNKGDYVAVEPA